MIVIKAIDSARCNFVGKHEPKLPRWKPSLIHSQNSQTHFRLSQQLKWPVQMKSR